MDNPRCYGSAPFMIAVVHGGPGALGSMAPVARELASQRGVLDRMQTSATVEGQLSMLLTRHAGFPITLIGHSWGAWLRYMFAQPPKATA